MKNSTKVSDKYQVVIPKSIRTRLGLKRGQKLLVYCVGSGILMTPEKKWPDDYVGLDRDIWSKVDVIGYLRNERRLWDQKTP